VKATVETSGAIAHEMFDEGAVQAARSGTLGDIAASIGTLAGLPASC
jgi:hypothetical protein